MNDYYPDWLASEDEPIFDAYCEEHIDYPTEAEFDAYRLGYILKFENREDDDR